MMASKSISNEVLWRNEVRLLAAIGFIAARNGLHVQASEIFEGIIKNRPNKPFGYLGLALASISIGDSEKAISVLRNRGLVNIPDDAELAAWLAILLQFSGEVEAGYGLARKLAGLRIDGATLDLLGKFFNSENKGSEHSVAIKEFFLNFSDTWTN